GVVELPAEAVERRLERDVEEPRVREAGDEVLADAAEVGIQDRAVAASEEVVLGDARVEEEVVGGAEAGAGGEGAGLPLFHVDLQIQLLLAPAALGGEVHLLEEAEAVEGIAALLQLGPRELLLLFDLELAADDLVARLRVAGDQDLVDRHL